MTELKKVISRVLRICFFVKTLIEDIESVRTSSAPGDLGMGGIASTTYYYMRDMPFLGGEVRALLVMGVCERVQWRGIGRMWTTICAMYRIHLIREIGPSMALLLD